MIGGASMGADGLSNVQCLVSADEGMPTAMTANLSKANQ